MSTIIVTGTDTGIGKTVFSAGLTRALGATYWKPVQSGLDEATDSETVAHLSGRPVLQLPASPHLSAEAEGVEINLARLTPPPVEGPLVIEGAGGLMVPLTRQHLFLDVIAGWQAPVVLVARTSLGTINHSLLSLAALRSMACTVAGVVFVGDEMADSRRTIAEMGRVRDLGRLPFLADLTPDALAAAFAAIDVAAIRETL